jgi:hypothetical protein
MNPTINYYICDYLKIECADLIGIVADKSIYHDNIQRMPVIFAHYPAGTSL